MILPRIANGAVMVLTPSRVISSLTVMDSASDECTVNVILVRFLSSNMIPSVPSLYQSVAAAVQWENERLHIIPAIVSEEDEQKKNEQGACLNYQVLVLPVEIFYS